MKKSWNFNMTIIIYIIFLINVIISTLYDYTLKKLNDKYLNY